MAKRVKVIKAARDDLLEVGVNKALANLGDSVVDIKVAGSFNGEYESFVVVIVYEA